MVTYVQPPEAGIDIMLDLETMGTDPWSPIIAIGAVRFIAGEMTGPMEPFYQAIKLESCMKVGLRPTAGTIQWWMKQKPEAQAVFDDPNAVDLPLALDAFTDWYGSRPDNVWGNSAAFDIGLLKDAYKACGKEFPVAFYRERCYRTLKGLPGMERFSLKRRGTHHNALDDAISQAGHCRDMLQAMYPRQIIKADLNLDGVDLKPGAAVWVPDTQAALPLEAADAVREARDASDRAGGSPPMFR